MQDSPEVLERFHQHLGLVPSTVRALAWAAEHALDTDDLESYGREGLLDASRRYDPERGVPFRSYAKIRIRGAIIDGMRRAAHLPRRVHQQLTAARAAADYSEGRLEDLSVAPPPGSNAAQAEAKLNDHLAGMATAMAMGLVSERSPDGDFQQPAQRTPEHEAETSELAALLRESIETLPEQEAELVRRHYFEGEQFDQIAADMGISKSWISRIHTRAIDRLTKRLKPRT